MPILDLPNFQVVDSEELEKSIRLVLETVSDPTVCQACRDLTAKIVKYGKRKQRYMDMPIRGKAVDLLVRRKRFRCYSCNQTFFEHLEDMVPGRLMTKRLKEYIEQEGIHRPFTSIAKETGLKEKTVRDIFHIHIDKIARKFRFETPEVLGIDEIHLLRVSRFVVTNIKEKTVIEMLANRNKPTVINFFRSLDASKVKYVCMDMWNPYRDAVREVFPNARIIIDKYHIVRMASEAMESVRKKLRADLTTKQRRRLKNDRFTLLKRRHALNDKERLNVDIWSKAYPLLGAAYELKEAFYEIWDDKEQGAQSARARYYAWREAIPEDLIPDFQKILTCFMNWEMELFGYFTAPYTNAYTEGLNSRIRDLDRKGRGYTFNVLRVKVLTAEGVHKKTVSAPKYDKNAFSVSNSLMSGIPYETNYGVDISTFMAMVDKGDIK
ncbi:MAG: ISL3 family transposase [Dehalococcoidia bacterium]|nr:MAG: ISL3 family transposase [Dehalococcoidia bacterium]